MSKVHFFPDLSYHEAKNLEEKYNAADQEFLINKASDFICNIVSRSRLKNQKFLFICGPGSNGLDGIYCAHKLVSRGFEIEIFNTKENSNMSILEKFNLSDKLVNDFPLDSYDYIVDCIFGYGFNRDLDDEQVKLINRVNSSSAYIYSVDVPSGLNPLTGETCPVCVKCNCLISLLSYKRGIFTNKGRETWEDLYHSNLIPNQFTSENYLISASNVFTGKSFSKDFKLNFQPPEHKKSNGISCIISGEQPYHGAMLLSVAASIKTGCQYLHVYTNREYAHTLPMIIPEVISKEFCFSDFKDNFDNFTNILLGPGTDKVTSEYLDFITNNLHKIKSIVVDAGGLKFLKRNHSYMHKLIITPHPGEAADLLNLSTDDVQNNRYESAKMLHDMFDCIVILKGSGTVIYDGDKFYTCMDGNHRMAVAGTGDTLSGILLCELSLNPDIFDACIKATTFHSYSADHLFKSKKIKNYLPSMIPDTYSKLVNI